MRTRDTLAALSGVALVGAFAPFSIAALAFLAPAALLVLLEGASPRAAARRGWLFGLGLFGAGVYWVYVSLHDFGNASPPFAALVTVLLVSFLALYPAALGWGLQVVAPRPGLIRYLLVFPSLWTVLEWLRERFLTGFPWLGLGYSQADTPLAGWFPVVGVLGAGTLVALGSGCLVVMFHGSFVQRVAAALLLASTFFGGLMLEQQSWTQPTSNRQTVAIVQGNIPQQDKWEAQERVRTLEHYRRLTLSSLPMDLVVWPETAVPVFRHEARPFLAEIGKRVGQYGGVLLTGLPVFDRNAGNYYNSVVVAGNPDLAYHKRHLVPFGEYLPLRTLLRFFETYVQIPMSDFSAGRSDTGPIVVDGLRFGISICYEAAFGEEIRLALPDANVLVNVSNDAWFGASLAPHQHLEIARTRAMETGRDLIRATNTGISALIDHRGRILGSSRQFEATVLSGGFLPRVGATPYVRYGQAPVFALVLAVVVFVALVRLARRRSATSDRVTREPPPPIRE